MQYFYALFLLNDNLNDVNDSSFFNKNVLKYKYIIFNILFKFFPKGGRIRQGKRSAQSVLKLCTKTIRRES